MTDITKSKKEDEKEIEVLTPREHILLRPSMYIGSTTPSEEKILKVENGKVKQVTEEISVGLYRLFDEILDNAVDEYRRCQKIHHNAGPIQISVDSKTNTVTIKDSGKGFYNAEKINSKSGVTNVESALTLFAAGSNFRSDDEEEAIVGTNGIGSAAVNMLSDYFSVKTINDTICYFQEWKDFVTTEKTVRPKDKKEKTGTTIEFKPLVSVFKKLKYESSILESKIALRQFSINHGKKETDKDFLKFEFSFDGKNIPIETGTIFPSPNVQVDSKKASFVLWESFDESASFSMINGSLCSGIHQKIVIDMLNKYFDYPNAHHFYEFFVSVDIPPRLMKFGDQNKTKFMGVRNEIEPIISKEIFSKILKEMKSSPIANEIREKIRKRKEELEIKNIKSIRKKVNVKVSDKYFPSSKSKERIFLTEGLSAAGSINQARNSAFDSVYALRGKIKNTKTLADLSSNVEIAELMNILNLDISKRDGLAKYKNIIIATDADCLAADTLIQMSEGFKEIKNINRGDMVMSPIGLTKVIDVVEKIPETFLEITSNGSVFRVMREHIVPTFESGNYKEVKAKDLNKNSDSIIFKNDTKHGQKYFGRNISSIIEVVNLENIPFYDITLEFDHKFFIYDPKLENYILAHNCDGSHISALIINFFTKWFPAVIKNGQLHKMIIPICSITEGKSKKYFYSMNDAEEYKTKNNIKDNAFSYYKGLGSYALDDWEYIFSNTQLQKINYDAQADKHLEIAFGKEAAKRRKWLEHGN
jgi:DNA topoisomerase-2